MAGSNTRPGFCGGDEPPPLNPEEDSSPRAARTVLGHEIHLRARPKPLPTAVALSVPQSPVGVPESVTDEKTEEVPRRPSHSGKSKLPALARLFGRWTTGGGFLSRSGMFRADDDSLNVPRDPWVSRVAMFVVAAILSFLVALAVLKVHRCSASVSPPSVATQISVSPASPTPPAASAAFPVLPAPPWQPQPLVAAFQPPPAAVPAAPAAQAPAAHSKSTHRSAQTVGGSSARVASGASGRPHAQHARPAPPKREDLYKDALLPLGL